MAMWMTRGIKDASMKKWFQPFGFHCFRAVTKTPFFAVENRGRDPASYKAQHKETRSFQPLHWDYPGS